MNVRDKNIECTDHRILSRKSSHEHNLFIRNSLTGEKERFVPIKEGKVSMYVCGMTVYDYCHIGHARVLIVFDMIDRYLRHIYGENNVNHVRNITDIDDKIISRSIENNESVDNLTNRFIHAMHEDSEKLNVRLPDLEPRATDNMEAIKEMISALISKGYAYKSDNGDVYYEIDKFKEYGKLSDKDTSELRAGSRITINESKRNPLDFTLWKKAIPGEPSWNSDWGSGRPGWHIECSAMSRKCLGDAFDIHGGGLDLKFPHHENEIAQSEGCIGHKHVNYWIHNGFIRVDNEKMSKSLGNFFIIRDVLKEYNAETIRFFILSSHYMSPLNYSTENLDIAKKSLNSLYTSISGLTTDIDLLDNEYYDSSYSKEFYSALDDDFNTPVALSVLHKMSHELNVLKKSDANKSIALASAMIDFSKSLGILQQDAETYLQSKRDENDLDAEIINELIVKRSEFKKANNWAKCDEVRDYLLEHNIVLKDSQGTTEWRRS